MPHSMFQDGEVPGGNLGTISVEHVFSCEADKAKRNLLLQQGGMRHLFDNVTVFDDGHGYCYVCEKDHTIDRESCGIDILEAGPACVDISRCNNSRAAYVGCYNKSKDAAPNGSSGLTYLSGFRKVGPGLHIIYIYLFPVPTCYI